MYATPLSSGYNTARLGFLTQMMIDDFIPPHAVREGFIYTRRRDGMWRGNVLLISENSVRRLSFLFPGERLRTDHQQLEFERYYADSMASTNLQESRLQAALSALPCYATDASGRKTGDPLNFIVIGNQQHLFSALIGAEWDETERLDIKSAWRTCWSFVSGTGYRTSPISPLYVFGRRQDTSFQKIRKSVHSRIHLRLWLTSLRYQDTPVWIGQVSRDIGVKLTPRTPNLTTHMIDPDVDADRWYLVQELLRGQAVDQLGLVDGCASHTPETPGRNLTEDNFFTDGLRVVLFLSKEPTAMDEVHLLDWAKPPESLVPVTYPSTD
ncbi:MAG: hypothetical protein EOM20_07320 [Spartobacteria bacterium]|nr:hypothetical protein [Spartobacteria bacterium]